MFVEDFFYTIKQKQSYAYIWHLFLCFCFPLCSRLCFSIEFMFVHSNGGQGRASKPHPLRPHRIWDNHCRSCCQDSQNTASRGYHGGKAVFLHPVQSPIEEIWTFHCIAVMFDLCMFHQIILVLHHLVRCTWHPRSKTTKIKIYFELSVEFMKDLPVQLCAFGGVLHLCTAVFTAAVIQGR